jgi:hypothetical protein
MTQKQGHTQQSPSVSNYDRALARAVEWLGDRYLLAKPINAHTLPRLQSHRFSVDTASTA